VVHRRSAPISDADWADPLTRTVALLVDGCAEPDRDERGRPMIDDLLVLFNGWWGGALVMVKPRSLLLLTSSRPGTMRWSMLSPRLERNAT
jgi:hypothetical protein